MTIKVCYSFDRDVQNYLDSVYKFKYFKHGREEIVDDLLKNYPGEFKTALKNAAEESAASEVITSYLSKDVDARKLKYLEKAKELESLWNKKNTAVIEQLEKLYKQKFPFNELTVYYTSVFICPYNMAEKWIMAYGEATIERQFQTVIHELNHWMFYTYHKDLLRKISNETFESLKEALAVFTNPEQSGYPNQFKLRAWFKTQKKSIPEILSTDEWMGYLPGGTGTIDTSKLPYRKNVGCVAFKGDKFLLVRKPSWPEDHWKTPQGGIDEGESDEETVKRELLEELGTGKFKIIGKSKHERQYDWSDDAVEKAGYRWKGQNQKFFLAEFTGKDSDIKLDSKEIDKYKWMTKSELLKIIDIDHKNFTGYKDAIEKILEEFKEVF